MCRSLRSACLRRIQRVGDLQDALSLDVDSMQARLKAVEGKLRDPQFAMERIERHIDTGFDQNLKLQVGALIEA